MQYKNVLLSFKYFLNRKGKFIDEKFLRMLKSKITVLNTLFAYHERDAINKCNIKRKQRC